MADGNEMLALSPATMMALETRGIPLTLDIYGPEDED